MCNKNILFFFGAGAEFDLGLPSGLDFAKIVLGINKIETMNDAIEEYYREVLNKVENKEWYSDVSIPKWSYENLIEAAFDNYKLNNKAYNENKEIKDLYDKLEKSISAVKTYYYENKDQLKNKEENKNKTLTEIKNDLINKEIENNFINSNNKKTKDIFNNFLNDNISYMGIIDEKFHTLISPKILGPKKAWMVIITYTRAYLGIVGSIELIGKKEKNLNSISKDKYLDILNNPLIYIDKYNNIQLSKNSYYKKISNHKDFNKLVITTNYTPFSKKIVESNTKDFVRNNINNYIAYPNGKIGFFESPRNLSIIDITDKQFTEKEIMNAFKKDLYFPFVFIQSGIKPIISRIEIKEYNKMINLIDNTNTMVILGYSIGNDDNHINSFIREFLIKKNNKIYYLDYCDNEAYFDNYNPNKKKKELLEKLRIDIDVNLICKPIIEANETFDVYLNEIIN